MTTDRALTPEEIVQLDLLSRGKAMAKLNEEVLSELDRMKLARGVVGGWVITPEGQMALQASMSS